MAEAVARVCVAGGSLAGLTAALALRDAGCGVDVFERSASELYGYGAGIVVHEATVRYFRERTQVDPDTLSVPSRHFRYLGRDGCVVHEERSPYRFTSYGTLYRNLLALLGRDRYHLGEALVGFGQDAAGVD